MKQQPPPRNLVNLQREHTALRSRIDRLVPAVTQALVRLHNENLKLKKQFDELNAKLEQQQRSVQNRKSRNQMSNQNQDLLFVNRDLVLINHLEQKSKHKKNELCTPDSEDSED